MPHPEEQLNADALQRRGEKLAALLKSVTELADQAQEFHHLTSQLVARTASPTLFAAPATTATTADDHATAEKAQYEQYKRDHSLTKSLGESEWTNKIHPHVGKALNKFDAGAVQTLRLACLPSYQTPPAEEVQQKYTAALQAQTACLDALTHAALFIKHGEYGKNSADRHEKHQRYTQNLQQFKQNYDGACAELEKVVAQNASRFSSVFPQPQSTPFSFLNRRAATAPSERDPLLTPRDDAPRGCCGLC